MKNLVEELHVSYSIKRVHKEGSEETNLEELDNDYIAVIEKTHREAVKVYHKYCSQLKLKEQYDLNQKVLSDKLVQYRDKLR